MTSGTRGTDAEKSAKAAAIVTCTVSTGCANTAVRTSIARQTSIIRCYHNIILQVKIKFEYWLLAAFFIDSQDPSTSGSRPRFATTLCFTLTMASAVKINKKTKLFLKSF